MYRTINAIYDIQKIIKDLLVAAGFKDGRGISQSEVKNATEPIFWYINVPTKEASDKETYIVYSITGTRPHEYGDGKIMTRKASVQFRVMTRNRDIRKTLHKLENKMISNLWTFELLNSDFDNGLQMTSFTFLSEAVIMDG